MEEQGDDDDNDDGQDDDENDGNNVKVGARELRPVVRIKMEEQGQSGFRMMMMMIMVVVAELNLTQI